MASLRSVEMVDKYNEYQKTGVLEKGCHLCDAETLKRFNFWKIVKNDFPYDIIAKVHHMLVPLRHGVEGQISQEEYDELRRIKEEYVNPEYDYIIEATTKNKSIPEHFHLHLIIGK